MEKESYKGIKALKRKELHIFKSTPYDNENKRCEMIFTKLSRSKQEEDNREAALPLKKTSSCSVSVDLSPNIRAEMQSHSVALPVIDGSLLTGTKIRRLVLLNLIFERSKARTL